MKKTTGKGARNGKNPVNDFDPNESQTASEFHKNHGTYVETLTQENRKQSRNITQIPLDFYFNRKFISIDQKTAGEQLFEDFTNSGIVCRSRSLLKPPSDGVATAAMQAQAQSHQSYRRAMDSVHGKITQLLLFNVVCIGEWLKDVNHISLPKNETDYLALPTDVDIKKVPIGDRMSRFREGLSDLLRHYERTIVKRALKRTASPVNLIPFNQMLDKPLPG